MSFFQNFLYSFKQDAIFRKKTIFILSSSIFIMLLLSFLFWLNFGINKTLEKKTEEISLEQVVTEKNFDTQESLEKINDSKINQLNQLIFIPGGKIGFLDEGLKLKVSGENIENSPTFATRTIYTRQDKIILNEENRTTLYQNGSFRKIPDGNFSVTPVLLPDNIGLRSIPGYLLLSKKGSNIILRQSVDIDSGKTEDIANIQPSVLFQFVEIRILNQNPYLFFYENISRQGKTEIWKLDNKNNTQKVKIIENLQSILFDSNKVMYTKLLDTPTELTPLENNILDFTSEPDGVNTVINLAQTIGQKNIFGSVVAERCSFGLNQTLYCLVKENKVSYLNSGKIDRVIKTDLKGLKTEYLYSNLTISGDKIYTSSNGQNYIIGQENRKLYRLK
jgi:hypothetical protein